MRVARFKLIGKRNKHNRSLVFQLLHAESVLLRSAGNQGPCAGVGRVASKSLSVGLLVTPC
jgi:hypothetical protein